MGTKKIADIDKNFELKNTTTGGMHAFDVLTEPFEIYGLLKPKNKNDKYRRMPEEIAESVSEGVHFLHSNTAGGRIRFATDSSRIGLRAKLPYVGKMGHFTLAGSAGFDLYATIEKSERHIKTFIPPFEITDLLEGQVDFGKSEMREYTLNLPLYSDVSEIEIMLDSSATVKKPTLYKTKTPVVYYGSSITQGGCASRPGNSYQAILSRRLDCDYINLGFSGCAKGEREIAEYISTIDMSAFVYDYDHNAPDTEHLMATHEKMFKIIRSKQPSLPIICLTAPMPVGLKHNERKRIIHNTVTNAVASGDKNVYYIDVTKKIEEISGGTDSTVDCCHPNDLGFFHMANIIEPVLENVLK